MKDTLDTLAKKADAVKAMYDRGDSNYTLARELLAKERQAWLDAMSEQMLRRIQSE